jgi:hypothetical protein
MNISRRIYDLKTIAADSMGVPCYFQLAPINSYIPYAVLDLQSVEQVRSATQSTNWQAGFNLTVFAANDTDCLSFLDSIVDGLDRKQSDSWYFCRVSSVSVSANYLDKSATWSAAVGLIVQWTITE